MRTHSVSFTNKSGKSLDGRLDLPVTGKPYAYAIFAHCFTCNKSSKAATVISRCLASKNIAVLRFDFTGLGTSEGDFEDSTFSSDAKDIAAAADFLRENYSAPQLLVGHSLGGTASLCAAAFIPEVKAVCTIGSPASPEHVNHLFTESLEEIESSGKATIAIGGRPFVVSSEFVNDLKKVEMIDVIKKLNCSFLFLHSPSDEVVEVHNASKLFYMAEHPRSFISLDDADHLLTEKKDAQYAGELISTWSEKYVEGSPFKELKTDKQAVVRIGMEKYYTEVLAGDHPLVADEPEKVGGQNLGATPYDFLVVALGTCTAMTLRMYADHKGWPLEEVFVHLEHYKSHKDDCDCENGEKLDKISREIRVEGENLTQEQHERLMQIADRCPVHKTVTEGVQIITTELQE